MPNLLISSKTNRTVGLLHKVELPHMSGLSTENKFEVNRNGLFKKIKIQLIFCFIK